MRFNNSFFIIILTLVAAYLQKFAEIMIYGLFIGFRKDLRIEKVKRFIFVSFKSKKTTFYTN